MKPLRPRAASVGLLGCLVLLAALLVGCQETPATVQASSAPVTMRVASVAKLVWAGSYASDIQPIFDRNCVSCHGSDRAENGLNLASFGDVMRGTQYGPVVVPGSASRSTLISVVRGTADPSIRMPYGKRRLSDEEMQNLVLWIEAGAPSD